MKSLVTAQHFNITSVDAPCANQIGHTPTTTCRTVQEAPGMNSAGYHMELPMIVDGPFLEFAETEDTRYRIQAVIQLTIIFSGFAALCSFAPLGLAIKKHVDPWVNAKRLSHCGEPEETPRSSINSNSPDSPTPETPGNPD